jgi:hypothetical protein
MPAVNPSIPFLIIFDHHILRRRLGMMWTITGQANTSSIDVGYLFTTFFVLTITNALEVIVLVFVTFKKYGGSYFWSLLVATIGLIVSTIGSAYYFYSASPEKWAPVALGTAGWCAFVTGQAVVLWSRLHLLVQSQRLLRAVLIMIIVDAIIFHVPTVVFSFMGTAPNAPAKMVNVYAKWENVQLTGFCAQEFIISAIYIRETIGLLKNGFADRRKRNMIYQLLAINIIILCMDVVLLGIQYSNQRSIQIQLKALIYSFKLKLEFAVLSRLVNFVVGRPAGGSRPARADSTPSFVHLNDPNSSPPNSTKSPNASLGMQEQKIVLDKCGK